MLCKVRTICPCCHRFVCDLPWTHGIRPIAVDAHHVAVSAEVWCVSVSTRGALGFAELSTQLLKALRWQSAWALRCRCDMIASYSTPPVSRFHPAHAASADRSTHEWMRMAPSVTRHRSYRSSTMRAHGKTLAPWSRHGRRAASKRRWSGGAPAKLIAQRPPCNVARPRADSRGDNRSQPRG